MKTWEIDLQDYRNPKVIVLTGRNNGIDVRLTSNIDELEKIYEQINIKVPSDIMSINPSFLEEFLFNVVKKLGKDKFYEKFKFITDEKAIYNITKDLEEAVQRILRVANYKGNQTTGTKITRLKNLMTPLVNYFAIQKSLDDRDLTDDKRVALRKLRNAESSKIQILLPEIREILSQIPDDACENNLKL